MKEVNYFCDVCLSSETRAYRSGEIEEIVHKKIKIGHIERDICDKCFREVMPKILEIVFPNKKTAPEGG